MKPDLAEDLAKKAKAYARQMEKGKEYILENPEEWDFSAVELRDLAEVIKYEYLRENEELRARICKFLNSSSGGKTIREIILNGPEVCSNVGVEVSRSLNRPVLAPILRQSLRQHRFALANPC